MEVNLRPRLQSEERRLANPRYKGDGQGGGYEKAKEDFRDTVILSRMWEMIRYGLSIFLGGFLLWHLDRVHCSQLRRWRHQMGMPWGFVLELHGWW
jgi:dihydroceramidase